ncbi:glycosyltransferase [Pseudodesulfovibrio tunisiensis]|uniref:glycosyltransferase n=1 Tax=Pseudodesulfovibrio tunisiensis TaxID=463192 RepID=UPI001FB42903|nr:glycosyltransferase [Pseudodesulfovibrio tunisiensis]
MGYLSDAELVGVYSGALALVFPSKYEGFGLPVAEAQACGCPVIATRCASLPEVGGDAALYQENPGEIEELASLLRRVAEDPGLRASMVEKGHARASLFSWEKTARLTLAAFVRTLGENSRENGFFSQSSSGDQ